MATFGFKIKNERDVIWAKKGTVGPFNNKSISYQEIMWRPNTTVNKPLGWPYESQKTSGVKMNSVGLQESGPVVKRGLLMLTLLSLIICYK